MGVIGGGGGGGRSIVLRFSMSRSTWKYIVDAGEMDLQTILYNDRYGSWFWFIGVGIDEGSTDAKNYCS